MALITSFLCARQVLEISDPKAAGDPKKFKLIWAEIDSGECNASAS